MQKLLEANKRKKSGRMRKGVVVAAMASLLAVEPLITSCAGFAGHNNGQNNHIAVVEPECRGRLPFHENNKKFQEDESSVSETRLQEIISELRKSTALISSDEAIGSGVVLFRCGGETAILTNRHVVQSDDAPEGKVILSPNIEIVNEGQTVRPTRILFAPEDIDLALVFVREDIGLPVPVAQKKPRIGARVVVVGNPLGVEDSVSMGIISNYVKKEGEFEYEAIQTDAAINPGNSGGGIFLANGELLGIATYKLILGLGYAEGMAYAIPLSIIQEFELENWTDIPIAPGAPKAEPPEKK